MQSISECREKNLTDDLNIKKDLQSYVDINDLLGHFTLMFKTIFVNLNDFSFCWLKWPWQFFVNFLT